MSENAFSSAFGRYVCEGDTITHETADGLTVTARIWNDDDSSPPWDREDGHGPVSDWRRANAYGRPAKNAGERVLSEDRGAARLYDFAEAVKIAKRDGWGVEGGRLEGETAAAYATRAAERDYQILKAWCDDEWHYVGVALQVSKCGVDLTGDYGAALWGIEANYPDSDNAYLTETANELLSEALEVARAKLAELVAAGADPAEEEEEEEDA